MPNARGEPLVMHWQEFGDASRALASTIAASGFHPDVVLCIARGGLIVGGALAYALDVKKCLSINVEYYTGIAERLEIPVLLPPTPDLHDMQAMDVLIADDVTDTGNTLALVDDFCRGRVGEARTAVLYGKPWSIVHSDYQWRETDKWIAFPWSADGPVAGAAPR